MEILKKYLLSLFQDQHFFIDLSLLRFAFLLEIFHFLNEVSFKIRLLFLKELDFLLVNCELFFRYLNNNKYMIILASYSSYIFFLIIIHRRQFLPLLFFDLLIDLTDFFSP